VIPKEAEEWQRLKSVLADALDLPADRRVPFVREQLAPWPSLVERAVAMLETDAGATTHPMEPSGIRAAQRVGNYILQEPLGIGGLGQVWLARRADEVKMRVAVKFLRPDCNNEHFRQRFKIETQILAALHHPNIVGLMDAGATNDGAPYFVMEYVPGVPIDRYVLQNRAPVHDRLKLFAAVCDAVQYAHAHLLVHRDLKPSNILVSADGAVKLLDFGVAKLLQPELLGGEEIYTRPHAQPMTPEFASPEQLSGGLITTATDIYSLGVLLFFLLTERLPFEPQKKTFEQYREEVCSTEPKTPSTIIDDDSALRMRETSQRVRRRLRGEIDHIVMMAMRKEPDRRYRTAGEMADDIRRFLAGLPVRAQPDSFAYRTRKFVARHRTAVAAAVLTVVSLTGGLVVALREKAEAERQHFLAEQRLEQVRGLARSVRTTLAAVERSFIDPASAERDVKTVAARLSSAPDNAELRFALAEAYGTLADALGRSGRRAEAYDAATKAVTLLRDTVPFQPAKYGSALEVAKQRAERLAGASQAAGGPFGFAGGAQSSSPFAAVGAAVSVKAKMPDENVVEPGAAPDDAVRIASAYLAVAKLSAASGDKAGADVSYTAALNRLRSLGEIADPRVHVLIAQIEKDRRE
jgi:tRNA A-37 threonylcarbamoyl transferase component Bud32